MADQVGLVAAIDRFCAALGDDVASDEILEQLAHSALQVLDVDGAGVMALDDDELSRVAYATDGRVAELEGLQALLQSGPCRDAYRSGAVLNVADLAVEGDWPIYQATATEAGLRAVAAVPLRARDRTWGVLDVYRSEPRRLDEDELRAVSTLARLAVTYLIVADDRDAARDAQQQLAQLAMHDPLTQLPVRWVFLEHLGRAIAALGRGDDAVAVLFLDLDGLKYVNDTRGHAAGDEMLVECARRIRNAVRPGDVVARIGGDEFVVLLDRVTEAEAVAVARRVLDGLRGVSLDPVRAQDQPDQDGQVHGADGANGAGGAELVHPAISASIGIALTTETGQRPDTLVAHADAAMYEAKRSGAGRFALFDPARYDAERLAESTRLQIGNALRAAVPEDHFELHYQPIVTLRSAAAGGATSTDLFAVEALLRWNHPERGLLAAAEFLPMVENSPLMVEVGTWVIRAACRQLGDWDRRLGPRAPLRLFLNLSVAELVQPGLVRVLATALEQAGITPERIAIEVTETGFALSPAAALEAVQSIRSLGCTVAIDDFGSGYSSLSRLERMPADVLKIDGSFARDLDVSPAASAIVSAVLLLGRSLDRVVVVEGVEDEQTARALTELGCTHLQGYQLGRPMPAPVLEAFLTDGGV